MQGPAHSHREEEDFFPRMIVWQLSRKKTPGEPDVLTTHECLLIIDSIARIAKPIIVLTGRKVAERPDLFQIVEYGFALGLKMIIEVAPQELTDEMIEKYVIFGPKVFRLLLDGAITEDMDTRFKQSTQFQALENSIRRLKKAGYEIHLGSSIHKPDTRQLAFEHDFALQKSANGLYCHLAWDAALLPEKDQDADTDQFIGQFISKIAQIKRLSPKGMYFSPQCIKYGLHDVAAPGEGNGEQENHKVRVEWTHWCLAGRSFIFISPTGSVQPCASLGTPCGELRENNYNFREIWYNSEVLAKLRSEVLSCPTVRELLLSDPVPEQHETKK